MAFDVTLAIIFVGFSGILAYLASNTHIDSEHTFIAVLNSAMKLLFFAGSLGFILIGLNYGTLITEDACAPSGIQDVPVIGYKVSVYIFIFVMFAILLSVIYTVLMGMRMKKKKEEER